MHWKEWKPGRFPEKTLQEVLAAAPRVYPEKIPWQVQLLENPESKWAFPGAISLFRHDCIHALRWGFYQFCVNDEGRLTTWLRMKNEEAQFQNLDK